jgi:hypothetical protein
MRSIQVLHANGSVKTHAGPAYRGLLIATLRTLKRKGEPLPFSEADAKALPLTELVRMDNAWSEANKAGTFTTVVGG